MIHQPPISERATAQGASPQHVLPPPITFTRPEQFTHAASPSPFYAHRLPEFEAVAREQFRRGAQSILAATIASPSLPDAKEPAEQKLVSRLEELLARKCQEFSSQLETRFESFCAQTASRLGVLSEDIVHQFCEDLNPRMTEALNALMADRAEYNRALIDAECHAALDRFAARLEKLSSVQLDSHRKEIQVLSVTLKTRLRGVAHALEELGPSHRA